MSELSKQALQVENTQSFPNNTTGYITPTLLRSFNSNIIDSTVNQTGYTSDSGSWNTKINNLNAFTASQQPSFTALNAFTASQLTINSGVNLFTQSADSSISQLNTYTASFSTSVGIYDENNFVRSVNEINFSGNGITASYVSGKAVVSVDFTPLNSFTASQTITNTNLNAFTASQLIENAAFTAFISQSGSFATTGSNIFTGTQTIAADLNVTTGSTNLGFVNIIDNGGINLAGNGSTRQSYGIVTNPSNGDLVFNTNPGNGRLMTFNETNGVMNLWNGMKLDTSFIGIDVYDHPLNLSSSFGGMTTMLNTQGNVVVSGSLITSGSSIVGGVQIINYTSGSGIGEVYLLSDSGSLIIGNSTASPTYSALSHLSSSVQNANTNLMFKTNTGSPDTIISGSSNIFSNPANVTAGFKRYVGGSQNYFGATLPQISGSTAFSPTFTGNIINTGFIMRTPVSSSAYNVIGNLIMFPGGTSVNLGTSAANNFEKAVSGFSMQNNVIGGQINAVASKTALSSSVNLNGSSINGTLTLNMDSSSIQINNALSQGQLTINNSYFPSTYNAGSANMNIGNFLNMGANFIFASGSNTTFPGPTRTINNSTLLGGLNVMSASFNGDNSQINSTHLIGQGLVAVGTNTRPLAASAADWGSTFVGRWNSIDGVKDQTAENVFVVGAGTSNTTRKTALLIDSGSNTFIEGTLTITGSVYGNVSASTITSSTASIDLSVANYFTLTLAGTTRINVINPQPGVTATLVINTDTAASASFSSNVKQPSGSLYAASPSGNIDIISFTAVDSTTVYAFPAQSFV